MKRPNEVFVGSGCHGLVAVLEHRATVPSGLVELAMMLVASVERSAVIHPGKKKAGA